MSKRNRQLAERELAAAARMTTLEEALALARDQLGASNQRAVAMERNVGEREAECARLRERLSQMEADSAHWRSQFEAASVAHQAERRELQERSAAAETRWLTEVDRARQQLKEKTQAHERQSTELHRKLEALQGECEQLRQDLQTCRAELKTAAAVREQLEARLNQELRALIGASPPHPPKRQAKRAGQAQRAVRRRPGRPSVTK